MTDHWEFDEMIYLAFTFISLFIMTVVLITQIIVELLKNRREI